MTSCKCFFRLFPFHFEKLMIYQGRAAARSCNVLFNFMLSICEVEAIRTANEMYYLGHVTKILYGIRSCGYVKARFGYEGQILGEQIFLFLPAICSSVSWSACGRKKRKRVTNNDVSRQGSYCKCWTVASLHSSSSPLNHNHAARHWSQCLGVCWPRCLNLTGLTNENNLN